MHIVVSKYGKIDDEEIERITETMQECYSRSTPHEVSLVDLYMFERSSSVEAFFAKECRKVGVASAPFDELFFAMHDAWRGIPRITLCFEKMKKLQRLVKMGGIRHEVGHSILHGNLRYYLLSFPPALLEIADQFNLPFEYLTNLLYLVSIAVKDYEVTRFLHQRGYVEDQIAYAKHLLKVSEDDILSWEISRGKPPAEALCLISCLKAAGCAAPLLVDKEFGEEVRLHLMESLLYLPTDRSILLLKVIEEVFPSLETDTIDNIDRTVRGCKLIFEAVFNR
ncbi:MAG: hypothetical protein OEX06_01750 [Candidatus Bathyarchaeota archaeon]|nr:hypothetical protein [Candidatus Bathyarchaeota archaeon]